MFNKKEFVKLKRKLLKQENLLKLVLKLKKKSLRLKQVQKHTVFKPKRKLKKCV